MDGRTNKEYSLQARIKIKKEQENIIAYNVNIHLLSLPTKRHTNLVKVTELQEEKNVAKYKNQSDIQILQVYFVASKSHSLLKAINIF